jgi:tetratricopeptide (TPR) repeat protein
MKDAERHLMTIFSGALDRDSEPKRAAYLDEACGGDTDLRGRVDALLRAHEQAGRFLEPRITAGSETSAVATAMANPMAGTAIAGRYKLIEEIGEGGMGAVWMAQQTEPVKRAVALKLIKPGMDSRQVLARFEAERQALALMDHPNIAKVLDAGTIGRDEGGRMKEEKDRSVSSFIPHPSSFGRPYFVMELVKGVPITKYCDEHRLTPRQRLELFVPVCQAVQHAHQKGIIHRDIKPSNILVAQYDGRPVPKVIDFGVAKAAGQQLTDKTLMTGFGALVGTLEYMSPEQAELNQLDIDTRSDIYSLGVVLYELLTGSTPLDRKALKRAAFAEVLRIIREEEPPKPSTRLSGSEDSLPSVSAQRQMEPAKLTKLVRGELDWIVMKALEKDRNRRYETANGFAQDVQRYLANEPVQACPPSAWYRFRKLVRRNQALFATATVVAATLLVASAAVTWKWLDAETARAAESVATEKANKALALAEERGDRLRQNLDRLNAANGHIELAHMLAGSRQWDQAENHFAQAVQLRKDNSYTLSERGQMFLRLGLWDLANADLERAYHLQEPARAQTVYENALLRLFVGDRKGYDQVCRRMFERFGQSPDDNDVYLVAGTCTAAPDPVTDTQQLVRLAERAAARSKRPWRLNALGVVYFRTGQYDKAIKAINDSLAVDPNWNKSWNYAFLAMAHHRLGQSELARQELQESGQALDKMVQTWLANAVGQPSHLWWHIVESQMHCREARKVIDGSGPSEDGRLWAIRSRALAALKRDREAADCYARATRLAPHDLQIRLAMLPPEQNPQKLAAVLGELKQLVQAHPEQSAEAKQALAQRYYDLGWQLHGDKRYEDAVQAYGQAIEIVPDHQSAWWQRAMIRQDPLKQYDLALADWLQVVQLVPNDAGAHQNLGLALCAKGRLDEAIAEFRAAIRINKDLISARYNLGHALSDQGKLDEAIAEYRETLRIKNDYPEAHNNLGFALCAKGLREEAIAEYREALRIKNDYPVAHNNLGTALCAEGRLDEAIAEFRAALRLKNDFPTARYNLGNALYDQGKVDEAIAEYREAIRIKKDYPEAHCALASALMDKGRLEEAIAEFREALRLKNDYPEAHNNLGNALWAKGRRDEAIAEYRAALRTERALANAYQTHNNLGNALSAKGLRDEAIAEYRAAVRLNPGFRTAHRNLGNALMDKGRLDEAIVAYRAALRLKKDYSVHNSLGLALRAGGRLDEAIAEYRAAIRLKKDLPETHVDLGNALMDKGLRDEAIAEYREALRIRKDYPQAHYNLAIALMGKGRLDEAIAEYREAIRLNKDYPEAHCNLGNALMAKGLRDEAIAEYRAAIRLKKDFPDAHNNLGSALMAKGLRDEAIAEYRAAIRLKKDFPAAHNNLGFALYAKGRRDEAIAEYREAIRLKKDDAVTHNNLGSALHAKGELDEAIDAFREAIRLKKDYAMAHYNLGLTLRDKGQLDQAIAAFREAISLKRDFAECHYNLGYTLGHKGELDQAIAAYREAIRLKKGFVVAHYKLGSALYQKKDVEGAIREYQTALKIASYAEAHCDLGAVLRDDKGDSEGAIREFQAALTTDSKHARARRYMGVALRKAIKDYDKAIAREPKNPSAWSARADFYIRLGLLDLAAADLAEAFQLQAPASAHLWFCHALLRMHVGDAEGYRKISAQLPQRFTRTSDPSANELARALTLAAAPNIDLGWAAELAELDIKKNRGAWSYNALGLVQYRAGKYEQALGSFREALRLDSRWRHGILSHSVLAMAYQRLDRAAEARQALTQAAQQVEQWQQSLLGFLLDPIGNTWWDVAQGLVLYREAKTLIDGSAPTDDPLWHLTRAVAFAALEDHKKANDSYKKAIELGATADQRNRFVQVYLDLLGVKLGDPGRAVALATRAIDFAPREGIFWNTLGATQYRAGDWKAAIAALDKSMELRKGGDSFDWFYLAMAHWQLGDKEKARTWFDQAVRWKDTHKPADQELRRLRIEAAGLLGIKNGKK